MSMSSPVKKLQEDVSSAEAEKKASQKYGLGDMFWAKVGTYPWWPCMIYYSPDMQSYFRVRGYHTVYHVQYFGPMIERGWVTEGINLIVYKGKPAFDKHVVNYLEENVHSKKSVERFAVKPKLQAAWDASWKEADEAMNLTPAERVSVYGRTYKQKKGMMQPGSPTSPNTSLNDSALSNGSAQTPSRRGRRKRSASPASSSATEAMSEDEKEGQPPRKKGRTGEVQNACKEEGASGDEKRPKTTPAGMNYEFQRLRISLTTAERKQPVCFECHQPEDSKSGGSNAVQRCEGGCGNAFHVDCLKTVAGDGSGKHLCKDCSAGVRCCFICGVAESLDSKSLIRCSVGLCRRSYHETCIRAKGMGQFARLEQALVCPAHTCHACSLDDPGNVRPSPSYRRCLLCPATYHTGEWCLPAASKELSTTYIICPRHLTVPSNVESSSSPTGNTRQRSQPEPPPKTISMAALPLGRPQNVPWCFVCSLGGHLVCCEMCPASFHLTCITDREVLEEFVCEECESCRHPRYGSIVWAKVGQLRWWPAEVLHPRHTLPPSTEVLPGQFPVRLFALEELHWLDRGRVFQFEGEDEERESTDDDDEKKENEKNNKKKKKNVKTKKKKEEKKREIEDDTKTEEERKRQELLYVEAVQFAITGRELRRQKMDVRMGKTKIPGHYKHIKSNHAIGSVKILKVSDLSELPQCDCGQGKTKTKDPCGPNSGCLNRELLVECHPGVCRFGEGCLNQRFVRREYPPQKPFWTGERGWGLKVTADVKEGQFVNEYMGDLIDETEATRRRKWAHENGVANFYMMVLDGGRIIDAGPKGNLSRFMNHSCSPNLYAQKWHVNGDIRVGLFALRDIKSEEELTFNYNFMSLGQEKLACHCGAPNCSGFLGVKPTSGPLTDKPTSGPLTDKPCPSPLNQNDQSKQTTSMPTPNGSEIGAASVSSSSSSAPSVYQLLVAAAASASRVPPKGSKEKPRVSKGGQRRHELDCYRCGDGGELVLCDKPGCPKVYHLACLGLEKLPTGRWHCPWHHCEVCGKIADILCCECTSSYCKLHSTDNIYTAPEGKIYCLLHDDLLTAMALCASTDTTVKD